MFIGVPIIKGNAPTNKQKIGNDYLASALLHENSDLKKQINNLEEENLKLAHIVNENYNTAKFFCFFS